MKKVLFVDRDGTIIREPADEQIDSFAKLRFLPGVFQALARLARASEYELVMVSNQDGLGTPSFPSEDFWPVQNFVIQTLEDEGVSFSDVHIDPSLPADNSPNRKPGVGMLQKYIHGNYDLKNSFVIGDRESDVQLAQNLGAKSIFIGKQNDFADFCSTDWREIAEFLIKQPRTAEIDRITKETKIRGKLNLDGQGQSQVNTGLAFFDHMLDQIAKHGGVDLELSCEGDLAVDEHHTIEDVGLALGAAFKQALGEKLGLSRYAFVSPMDESEAKVSIDLGGRPYLVWQADFKREKVGDLPTEMFPHFFKSFTDACACTLHVEVKGQNEHHKIEAIFKAFARCLKQALIRTEGAGLPSTKGVL